RIPLIHHTSRQYHPDLAVRQDWLKSQARGLRSKYAAHLGERGTELYERDHAELLRKRATGTVSMTDVGIDASYSGQVSIGTPAQDFLLILDTGSADLWVAGTGCTSETCGTSTIFEQSSSSSFSTSYTSFDITYGSGEAEGFLSTDTVAMGGFTITGQTFAVVNDTSAQLISDPLSGLMGLAWKSIAQSGATPFWEALAASGSWSSAEMGFFLQRYRGDASASSVETNGGEFSMGGLDTSKFTGDMNYISIDSSDLDYWRISMQAITVQNSTVSETARESAIDTGTTLIGVPTTDAQAIYALISGAEEMSAETGYEGYWQYPCSTDVSVSLQFGGLSYSISNADFNLGSFTQDTTKCTGAIYDMDLGSTSPITWIVGASFLKNVYSAFRYNPSAIGFAALSGNAGSVSNGTTAAGGATTSNGTGGSGSGSSGNGSGSGNSSSGS
ncbi:endopeptidase, partial [Naematelia encephala]